MEKKDSLPTSIEVVRGNVENEVYHFNRIIENAFERFHVPTFEQETEFAQLADFVDFLLKSWNTSSDKVRVYSDLYKMAVSSDSLPQLSLSKQFSQIENIGEFFEEVSYNFIDMIKRLSCVINEKLFRYCVSLREFCSQDVPVVNDYDGRIQNRRAMLRSHLCSLKTHYTRYNRITKNLHTLFSNGVSCFKCLRSIRYTLNTITCVATSWIEDDKLYGDILRETLDDYTRQTETLSRNKISQQEKVKKLEAEFSKFRKQFSVMLEEESLAGRQLTKIKSSLSNTAKQRNILEVKHNEHLKEVQSVTRQHGMLCAYTKSNISKLPDTSPVFKKIQELEYSAAQINVTMNRSGETTKSLEKHISALSGQQHNTQRNLDDIREKLSKRRQLEAALKSKLDIATQEHEKSVNELQRLSDQIKSLKIIISKRRSMTFLREIHSFGTPRSPRKSI